MLSAPIHTERFLLRPLTPDDASARYSSWLDDPSLRETIYAAKKPHDIEKLRAYIAERCGREDILFLGIFERAEGLHIGNIKYEPVDSRRGYALMGILIGEARWQGKGAAPEVLAASAAWLRHERGIDRIILGVSKSHAAAIRSYEKTGFRAETVPEVRVKDPAAEMTMVWRLS